MLTAVGIVYQGKPAGSPSKGAGPGGKDQGADVDLVGPGPAYERWKLTPENQVGRKKTEELRK